MDYSKKYTIKKHGGLGSGGNGVVKTAIAVAMGGRGRSDARGQVSDMNDG